MVVRDITLRTAVPASAAGLASGLAVAAVVVIAGGAVLGAAVAGGTGMLVAVAAAVLCLAAVYAYCDRLVLSAMLARPVGEVEHPELYRLVRELSKAARLPVPRLYLVPAQQPNSFTVGRGPRTAVLCCTDGLLRALDVEAERG